MAKPEPSIAIIGGGPSGLLTAHYLQERGYSRVYVLEKLGRVGGLCKTMTVGKRSFDLGANYVVPSYTEIRRLARKLDATLYSERPFTGMSVPDDPDGRVTTFSMFSAVTKTVDGKPIPLWRFGWSLIRYVWLRFKLRKIIDKPTFEGVEKFQDGALAKSIEEWLVTNRLQDLDRTFQLPVTMMGYGYMNTAPALYALKFMTLKAFIPMVLKEVPLIGRLVPWPKRFTYGYQRFFERLSWDLNVRTNIDIESIERADDAIHITYRQTGQDLNRTATEVERLHVDYLVLACPLKQFTEPGSPLTLDPPEENLFKVIEPISYCMTTRTLAFGEAMEAPLAAIYPIPPYNRDSPIPYGVAKQWPDAPFVQFYTRTLLPDDRTEKEIEAAVVRGVDTITRQMGGIVPLESFDTSDTFNRFLYFQHVNEDDIKGGWFTLLEKQQGRNRTFFVGGATNFELNEPIAEYSRNLVERHFPKRPVATPVSWKTVLKWSAAILLLLSLAYCAFRPAPTSIALAYPTGAGEAEGVSMEYWQVFQSNNTAAIAPHSCEASGQAAGTDPILCRLMAADRSGGDDDTTPMLIAGLYLWRVQTGLFPEVIVPDLTAAARYARRAADLGNPYAPGFQASAEWLLAIQTDDQTLGVEAARLLKQNTHTWAAFQGFIEMEQFSTRLSPNQEMDEASFAMAEDAYQYMLAACLLGDWTPSWMRLPAWIPINNFIMNATYIAVRIFGQRVCYNNPPAPFSLPGTFVVAGDMYLKQGDMSTAIRLYQNSLKAPAYESWSYGNLPVDRLGNLAGFRQRFLDDSGRILGEDPSMSMAGQSDFYCVMCHAVASAPH